MARRDNPSDFYNARVDADPKMGPAGVLSTVSTLYEV
jgi:hypothetical protein